MVRKFFSLLQPPLRSASRRQMPRSREDTVKIGFILPMTGQQQASTGKEIEAAARLYMS